MRVCAVIMLALGSVSVSRATEDAPQHPTEKPPKQTALSQSETTVTPRRAAVPQRETYNPMWHADNVVIRCPPAATRCRKSSGWTMSSAFYVNGVKVNFQLEITVLKVFCITPGVLEVASLPRYSRVQRVEKLNIYNCGEPEQSHATVFNAINVTVPKNLSLIWWSPMDKLDVRKQHFMGLPHLRSLELSVYSTQNLVFVSGDVLEPFDQLQEFVVRRVRINLPLTPGSRVQRLTLENGGPADLNGAMQLGECAQLRTLTVLDWNVTSVPSGWLAGCTRLEWVRLERLPLKELPAEMITGASSLHTLIVRNCTRLTDISPEFISKPMTLRKLDLSHNIQLLCPRGQETMGVLRALNHMPMLMQLDLRATGAQRLYATHWGTLPGLLTVKYMNNHVNELTYPEVRLVQARGWSVDLSRNPLRTVRYTRMDYEAALQNDVAIEYINMSGIFIDTGLDCDCRSYWFARALRERPEHAPLLPLQCSGWNPLARGALADVSLEAMVCQTNCTAGCECFERGRDSMLLVNCFGGALTRLPRIARLAELRVPHNVIKALQADNFPDTLVHLDLRDNKISRVEGVAVSKLFGAETLLLGGNPLACDCRAAPLLDALHLHSGQVLDYANVTCADGRVVGDLNTVQVCLADRVTVLTGVLASVLVLALATGVLYYRHERAVKVFLYARGWCQCWLDEEHLDRDKRYDVFVTFAHADEQFVVDELLPGLERGPSALSVCVHYRDWVVGDTIPEQIARSVAESRRTIAVMSRHFLASVWTRAEFRVAHALALSEGRPRLVVVLLEDVTGDERLDEELRAYLTTNTYLQWGDSNFWDKLRYALPHRRRRVTATRNVSQRRSHPV